MRRTIAAALLAVTAVVSAGAFAPANAVCGGGLPGEPCFCPDFIPGLDCMTR